MISETTALFGAGFSLGGLGILLFTYYFTDPLSRKAGYLSGYVDCLHDLSGGKIDSLEGKFGEKRWYKDSRRIVLEMMADADAFDHISPPESGMGGDDS